MKKMPSWGSVLLPGLLLFAAGIGTGADAGTSGAIYNMERMLNQPHPFARPAAPAGPGIGAMPRAMPAPGRPQPIFRPDSVGNTQAPGVRTGTQEARRNPTGGIKDIFSEIRVGALWHDEGPFSRNKEGGVDANFEVLFVSPTDLDVIWSPRPHLGLSLNSAGNTSQIYAGLTWEWDFWESAFAGFSLGGAVHDGKNRTDELDRKELGCRVLFRESINAGYRIDRNHSVMLQLDHISNAKLCSTNEGLESIGIRYGYRF